MDYAAGPWMLGNSKSGIVEVRESDLQSEEGPVSHRDAEIFIGFLQLKWNTKQLGCILGTSSFHSRGAL